MASNNAAVTDEYGEYEDWIELYNGDNVPVWLGDKFLTDNLSNKNKWQMPDITLQPGEFILFWADEDSEQGSNHTNFKLSAAGEEIGIFDSESTGFFTIDSIIFGTQSQNVSYGRDPDGAILWKFYTVFTPGFSNSSGAGTGANYVENLLMIYPNPVIGDKVYLGEKVDIKLFNATGELILILEKVDQFETHLLQPGLYFVINDKGQSVKLIIQ
jgi:hypothetical protein